MEHTRLSAKTRRFLEKRNMLFIQVRDADDTIARNNSSARRRSSTSVLDTPGAIYDIMEIVAISQKLFSQFLTRSKIMKKSSSVLLILAFALAAFGNVAVAQDKVTLLWGMWGSPEEI